MKNYLQLTLTGKKLFPIWIAFLVLFLAPYPFMISKLKGFQTAAGDETEKFYALVFYYLYLLPVVIVFFCFIFYAIKLIINNTEYKDEFLKFEGSIKDFLFTITGNFLLTVITFGIYTPWFTKKLYDYFASNTSYKSQRFRFKGHGTDLFMIYLFWIAIPFLILLFFLIFAIAVSQLAGNPESTIVLMISSIIVPASNILLIPFTYYSYKWIVNFQYKNYNIHWETHFWNSIAYLLGQVLLTLITFGVYFPVAYLRIYRYFVHLTVAQSENNRKTFGYDLEPKKDFLFIWKQTLLIILTLGIYFPWAVSNISVHIIGKTYIEETI
jgi:uncharacterized membrane protein YjgN (DUF898 family)